MSLINSTAIPSGASAYEIEQSLRFNDGSSPSLERTPSSNSNRKTWTYSTWFKRGNVNSSATRGMLLSAYENSSNYTFIAFDDGGGGYDRLRVYSLESSSVKIDFESNAQLRDVSGWYHLVVSVDTTQGTSSNRVKIYINGEQITDWASSTEPSQNYDTVVNKAIRHNIGSYVQSSSFYDGYMGEVNFIDGLAKVPADFGETGTYGEWKPIEYSGSYGTNGFYLPFKQDYTVEGFSTVIYTGNGGTQYIGGTGFQPDFTWIKKRNGSDNHALYNSLTSTSNYLRSNTTDSERTNGQLSFKTDGFLLSNGDGSWNASNTYVAWNWDMGGSNASNTTGSINSTVRANPSYGQSVVSYTGNNTAGATIGHGLSSSPEMMLVKRRTGSKSWMVYAGVKEKHLTLNETGAFVTNATIWNDTAPTSALFSVGNNSQINALEPYIAYCFHSVTGYSKIGSYSGSGNANNSVTGLGFSPAWIMVKRTDSADQWLIVDNTRTPSGDTSGNNLYAESSAAEAGGGSTAIQFDSNGFTLKGTDTMINASGGTYSYMAFADKREYAYWLDQSGNNNDWTSNNLTESDVMVDSPTNNFCTLNPLDRDGDVVVSEGNLKGSAAGAQHDAIRGTFGMSTGKWYYEAVLPAVESYVHFGISNTTWLVTGNVYDSALNWTFQSNGSTNNGSNTNSGITALSAGDIVQVAYDLDAGKIWWGVNNTWVLSGNPSTAANPVYSNLSGTLAPVGGFYQAADGATFNFGQDSSFAATKTAQGNQDSGGVGDFYYTPPTGFLALCTSNLPDVAVIPSEHFNTVLYSGDNASNRAISVGFQPNFVWHKARNDTYNHYLFDSVRGTSSLLRSNTTGAEETGTTGFNSFDADGFTVTQVSGWEMNLANKNYVNWNWKANGSGSSNTTGSINSTVSVNTDAGFSIVSYTGNATAGATVGHGLSSTPEMIIIKDRSAAYDWMVGHKNYVGTPAENLKLNDTSGLATADDAIGSTWNRTAFTSTVFTLGDGQGGDWTVRTNTQGSNLIAYCFHSVDGYSKVGSYVGNSSADGVFVNTGFKPAYVMVKNTSGWGWYIHDSAREPNNENDVFLLADSNAADSATDNSHMDFLSNGFKLRTASIIGNGSSYTLIYIAFAETPFKYSNAN